MFAIMENMCFPTIMRLSEGIADFFLMSPEILHEKYSRKQTSKFSHENVAN